VNSTFTPSVWIDQCSRFCRERQSGDRNWGERGKKLVCVSAHRVCIYAHNFIYCPVSPPPGGSSLFSSIIHLTVALSQRTHSQGQPLEKLTLLARRLSPSRTALNRDIVSFVPRPEHCFSHRAQK